MNQPWFDPHSGALLLDEYVAEMPSFRRIMADNVVTPEELREQSDRTVALLRQLESQLSPSVRSLATEALCELAVLNVLYRRAAETQS